MKWVQMKGRLKPIMAKIGLASATTISTIGIASADLAGDLTNLSTVITSFTTWVTDIMAVFMEPPLVIFVGLTIGGLVIAKVRRLMRG